MNQTYIKLLIGILLFATLVAITVLHVQGAERLIDLIYAALLGLGITHLSGSAPLAPPADKQSGFASLAMLIALGVLAVLLSGCASFQQALNGYESAAAVSLDATNDNVVKVWKYQACATPFSAVIRNPEVVPALRALCVPAGVSTPVVLLDSVSAAPVAK